MGQVTNLLKVLQHLLQLSVTKQCYMFSTKYSMITPKHPNVSVSRYLFFLKKNIYTLVEYVKPKQECVCTFPRFQDLHRTPWVNLGRPETQEVKSWNTQQLKNFGLLGSQRPKISPLDSVFQFFNDIYWFLFPIYGKPPTSIYIYAYIYAYIYIYFCWGRRPRDDAWVLWYYWGMSVYMYLFIHAFIHMVPPKKRPQNIDLEIVSKNSLITGKYHCKMRTHRLWGLVLYLYIYT